MQFTDAKNKLKELANGKYHSITYELNEYSNGKLETKCYLYIDPYICFKAPTWAEAFAKLEKYLHLQPSIIDLTEAPIEEEGKEE